MTSRLGPVLPALLVMQGVLALPASPETLGWAAWMRPAPELLAILLLAVALGRGWTALPLRLAAVGLLTPVTVLKVADLAMLQTLGRRFNPVGDLPLIDASVRLIAGSLGVAAAVAAVLGAILATALIAAGLWWAMGGLMRLAPAARGPRMAGLAGAALLVGAVMLLPGRGIAVPVPQTAAFAADRLELSRRTLAELRRFREMAAEDAMAGLAQPLSLIDRDVLVIFLESYGRTSFDTDFFSSAHLPILRKAQAALEARGLATASGFATSPTHGGQSWLAHATLANGLWVNDQTRYQAAIASGRRTLFHYAAAAGFRTAAVMPAIVRPWPEAATMGFQRILAAPDLGYRGRPFNWVTMPDQFTLTATDRLLRDGRDPRPLFAQIALISSHAPWTPVPRMLDWEAIGDGTEFDAMAQEGDPPSVVWRDYDRVRAQYRDTVSYGLTAVLEYAARQERPPLIVLLGDHQAATTIGLDDRREVPIHVIGPPDLVARTLDWGLRPGLIPPAGLPALPMDRIRDDFLRNFSGVSDVPPA